MRTNKSMRTRIIHCQRRTHNIISGPSYVKLVNRRTARHATICHVDGLFNGTYSEKEGSTHSRDYGSRGIEYDTHNLIKIQHQEYRRNEIGQETRMQRSATLPFIYSSGIHTHASIKKMRPSVKII